MKNRFLHYINSENIIEEPGTLLLGVSGGIDSMVMLGLFIETGFEIAVAHCNFGLRGAESDNDQVFVTEVCKKYNITLHIKRFETTVYSEERGISLQMAARELRYEWFDQVAAENKYSYISIAHNKNDLAETILLNIARGTGIRGLTGIKPKSGKIIRPLLFAERIEIVEHAQINSVAFREDSSNIDIKYKRNRLRHNIIPEFEAISPSFIDGLSKTAGILKDVEKIYSGTVNERFKEAFSEKDGEYRLSIAALLTFHPLSTFLYEFLRRWNFPREIIPDIAASLKGPPGKQFFSSTHRIVKDRKYIIVTPITLETEGRFYIEEDTGEISQPVRMKLVRSHNRPDYRIPSDTKTACLDFNLLHFPLILRKWQKGDYFQPFGMSGLKKLSDFFIDNKFSLLEKERTWILASGNKVVWIAGHRIDDRFKVTERTSEILMIELQA